MYHVSCMSHVGRTEYTMLVQCTCTGTASTTEPTKMIPKPPRRCCSPGRGPALQLGDSSVETNIVRSKSFLRQSIYPEPITGQDSSLGGAVSVCGRAVPFGIKPWHKWHALGGLRPNERASVALSDQAVDGDVCGEVSDTHSPVAKRIEERLRNASHVQLIRANSLRDGWSRGVAVTRHRQFGVRYNTRIAPSRVRAGHGRRGR